MKKYYILSMLLLTGQSSWAQIRDYQTTRLNSTSGAGVGSILSTESSILNPASSAFIDDNIASIQFNQVSLKDESKLRGADKFKNNETSQGVFISDNKGPVKGGMSYIKQAENDYKRERVALHAASHIGKRASLGFSYHYIQDQFPRNSRPKRDISHVVNAGLTYIISHNLTFGLVATDITKSLSQEGKTIAGVQYVLTDKINVLADYGFLYSSGYNNKFYWATALQVSLFKDFYVRGGLYEDKITNFKGYSWGLSWVGPRLGLEFAQKFSDQTGKGNYLYKDESLIDTSLSAFITF